jgi:predicted phosphodiesterase
MKVLNMVNKKPVSELPTEDIAAALVRAGGNITQAAGLLGCARSTLRDHMSREGLLSEYLRLARSCVKMSVVGNFQKRLQKSGMKDFVALEEYVSQLAEHVDKISLRKQTKEHKKPPHLPGVGVIQFSDVHFNEIVNDTKGNSYDFHIAAKRTRLHVLNAIRLFQAFGFKNVLVAFTGDLLNSDRRMDELLVNATNRAKATLLAVDILQQALLELNQYFNVTVASVTGNESRINKDLGWVSELATDNFDFQIFGILKRLFKDAPGITFLTGDPSELIVNVAGQNLLLVHGHNKLAMNPTTEVQKLLGKYSANGDQVDYVIFGHVHQAFCSDIFSRSASMVGANAYSDKALNLTSRASQNIYAFWSNGNRDAIKVDLQNCDHIEGYDIVEELEAYNAKSALKAQKALDYQESFRVTVH